MGELKAIDGGKREPCLYCGREPHPTPLACPRIAHLTIEDGDITGISFWEDFYEYQEAPTDPDAA